MKFDGEFISFLVLVVWLSACAQMLDLQNDLVQLFQPVRQTVACNVLVSYAIITFNVISLSPAATMLGFCVCMGFVSCIKCFDDFLLFALKCLVRTARVCAQNATLIELSVLCVILSIPIVHECVSCGVLIVVFLFKNCDLNSFWCEPSLLCVGAAIALQSQLVACLAVGHIVHRFRRMTLRSLILSFFATFGIGYFAAYLSFHFQVFELAFVVWCWMLPLIALQEMRWQTLVLCLRRFTASQSPLVPQTEHNTEPYPMSSPLLSQQEQLPLPLLPLKTVFPLFSFFPFIPLLFCSPISNSSHFIEALRVGALVCILTLFVQTLSRSMFFKAYAHASGAFVCGVGALTAVYSLWVTQSTRTKQAQITHVYL
jgi:hypothetical protein